MDKDTFSNDSVVTEMGDILCMNLDKDSKAGGEVAELFGVGPLPTLLFLDSDGSPRDSIIGYLPPESFLDEVKRIKSGRGTISGLRAELEKNGDDVLAHLQLASKLGGFNDKEGAAAQVSAATALLKAERGFDASSVDERFAIALALLEHELEDLYDQQVAAIARLDPNGESMPSRRLALDEAIDTLMATGDKTALLVLLGKETSGELLFEGWGMIQRYEAWKGGKASNDGDADAAKKHGAAARHAGAQAWKHCPEDKHGSFGNSLAWSYYEAAEELTKEEMDFAIDVAYKALNAAPGDVNVMDTVACCLYMAGHVTDAVKMVKECLKIDPDNELWMERMKEFHPQMK